MSLSSFVRRHASWLSPVAGLSLIVGLYWIVPGYRDFVNEAWSVLTSNDRARIEEWVDQFGWWGPLVIVLLMVLQMFLLVAPSWLLMVIAVLAYGPVRGAVIAIVAVAVAASVAYGIGYLVGEHGLKRLLGEKTERKVRHETERYGVWAVVIARLNPLLSNDAISFLSGLLGMGFWKFLGATLLGITPLAIAIALMGEEWQSLKTGLIALSIVSLAGLAVKVWIDKRGDASASA